MKIDFHTHSPNLSDDTLAIESVCFPNSPKHSMFCYGLHPWHIESVELKDYFEKLSFYKDQKGFLALGEIGLDRIQGAEFKKQLSVFEQNLLFAKKNRLQHIIIHCVKSLSDILNVVKACDFKGTLIFHDANFSLQDATKLIEQGHYLSFGANLMRPNAKAAQFFKLLNLDHIFLETDDQNLDILRLYERAAELSGKSIDEIEQKILKNFQVLFGAKI